MASNAEEYYRQILNAQSPAAYLAGMHLIPEQECEWLEFKGADKIAEPDILKYWSKALSGFANTAGGVLIWGIDARKDQNTGIDCATGLALVPDVDYLAQKLSDVLLNSVSPPIRGIEITPIKHTDKQGFVVCLIPEGTAKAHRAERDRQFYMRMRDNFDVPPVAVIRSLFYPQAAASLQPRVQVIPKGNSVVELWFYLKNVGTRTAKDVLAILTHDAMFDDYTPLHNGDATGSSVKMPFRMRIRENMHPHIEEKSIMGISIPEAYRHQYGLCFYLQTTCEDGVIEEWKCALSRNFYFFDKSYDFTPHSRETKSDN